MCPVKSGGAAYAGNETDSGKLWRSYLEPAGLYPGDVCRITVVSGRTDGGGGFRASLVDPFVSDLPLLLSVLAGIWGLAGSHTQKVSSILEIGVLLLYIGMAVSAGILWPEPSAGQGYLRGSACTWNLVFSGCGAVLAIAALAATPRKVKVAEKNIPQVEEIKQEQVEAKYNIVMEDKQEAPKEPVHGVLAGLTGIYAGAKIPLIDGEYVLLGRLPSNHLVFEGQANVSRKHCRIKWDAAKQKYIVRDYSSNGSFANGSEDCLPQNLDLELEPGTTIAIGDESNVFCLE